MSAGGSIGTQITGYGGKSKIVGPNVGGTNANKILLPSTGSAVTIVNLNPYVPTRLDLDIAGNTDITVQVTRTNVERIDASQATFSAGTVQHITAADSFVGVIEAGHTAVKITTQQTASATDNPTLVTSLGARAVLTLTSYPQPKDANGNFVVPTYTGPVITSDEETPVLS